MKRKRKLKGIDYLEQTLKWATFIKAHRQFATSLREVLDELYYLREKVQKDGVK